MLVDLARWCHWRLGLDRLPPVLLLYVCGLCYMMYLAKVKVTLLFEVMWVCLSLLRLGACREAALPQAGYVTDSQATRESECHMSLVLLYLR